VNTYDYLVVGSSCSGAMAAQTLVEAGVQVAMLDVGVEGEDFEQLIPEKDYLAIRRSDPDQYKYLIGQTGEGISWGNVSKGAQLTPSRLHIAKLADKYIPLDSKTFFPLESLSYGGLGIGWGLQCWEYSDPDLKAAGLNATKMRQAYEVISKRIGISGTKDAAEAYTLGKLKTYQPSAKADRNHQYIQNKYSKQAGKFKRQGVFVGRTPLALITEDFDGRKGYQYRDMDYYSNKDQSAWRPNITVDKLRRKSNFTYIGSHLVVSFSEKAGAVTLTCLNVKTNKHLIVRCRKLILASGALGSARIMLRSLGKTDARTSVLSNPHSYIPCLQPALLGKGSESEKLGLGQLSYFIDEGGDDSGISVATSYSYQSLMLTRVITQIPLNFADARQMLRYLVSGLIIIIAQHPDRLSADKYLKLAPSPNSPTGDKLEAQYVLSKEDQALWDKRERQYLSVMRKLRTFPLKLVGPGHGSAIHYAGTAPFSATKKDFSLDPSGRLHGTKHVYMADSSGFTFLPAKGLTFTLMANAHITAQNVLRSKL